MRSMSHISLLLNVDSVLCNMFHKKMKTGKQRSLNLKKFIPHT